MSSHSQPITSCWSTTAARRYRCRDCRCWRDCGAPVGRRAADVPPPQSAEEMVGQGSQFWPLRLARELDDAILDIRLNEFDVAVLVFKSSGDPAQVLAYDAFLQANKDHWLAREIRNYWKR